MPDRAPDGAVRGYYILSHDITDLTNTEKALREREAGLRLITDNVPALIAYVDSEKRYRFVNHTFEEWFQVPQASVLGMRIEDVIGAENFAKVVEHTERALAGEHVTYEETMTYAGGRKREFHATLVPDFDVQKNTVGYYALIVDVSERKKAEIALRESEESLARAQEIVHLGSWTWDIAADQLHWSAEHYRIFGLDPNGPTIEPVRFVALLHESDREAVDEKMKKALQSLEMYDIEYRVVRPDGNVRLVHALGKVDVDEAGKPYRMSGTVQDITEQSLADEQLRQSQKMEAIGQLTGGIAHDFNNLLSVIMTNLQLMERNAKGQTDLLEDIGVAMDAAEQGAILTQQLLAYSRKQALKQEVVNVNALLSDMSGLLDRTLGMTIGVKTEFAADLWNSKIDRNQLSTAILNLAVNARDAMQDGGQILIKTKNIHLAETDAAQLELAPGEFVSIEISDTGAGMPETVKARAFEPFFTTKEIGEGSGLGLSMVYGFVAQSGGHVMIDSTPESGTNVTLYLPAIHETAVVKITAPTQKKRGAGARPKILIVEDNPTARMVGARALNALGFDTVEAENGESALAVLEKTSDVALIFTDISMPGGMLGSDLAREARRRWPGTKVLFTSGYEEETLRSKGHLDADAELIRKPYRIDDLENRINKLLQEPEG